MHRIGIGQGGQDLPIYFFFPKVTAKKFPQLDVSHSGITDSLFHYEINRTLAIYHNMATMHLQKEYIAQAADRVGNDPLRR